MTGYQLRSHHGAQRLVTRVRLRITLRSTPKTPMRALKVPVARPFGSGRCALHELVDCFNGSDSWSKIKLGVS